MVNKKIRQSCIVSLVCIAAELIFSIILKAKSAPSSVLIGSEGTQSLVYFMPAVAGGILLALMAFTAFMINSSFKAFAKGSFLKWLLFVLVWLVNSAVALSTVIKISTMELFSFENSILKIIQFVVILFSLLSCILIKRMKIS